jgi:hypothetical protein
MLGVTYKQEDKIKTLNVTHFNIANIWHMKLGHINQQRLRKIQFISKDWAHFMNSFFLYVHLV